MVSQADPGQQLQQIAAQHQGGEHADYYAYEQAHSEAVDKPTSQTASKPEQYQAGDDCRNVAISYRGPSPAESHFH